MFYFLKDTAKNEKAGDTLEGNARPTPSDPHKSTHRALATLRTSMAQSEDGRDQEDPSPGQHAGAR